MYKLRAKPIAESEVLRDVMKLLNHHSQVALVWRQNTGAHSFRDDNGRKRFVRYGFVGASDIMGMMRGGSFFAVETKKQDYKPQGEKQKHHFIDQLEFLCKVNRAGGLGVLADDWQIVSRCIDNPADAARMAWELEEKLASYHR